MLSMFEELETEIEWLSKEQLAQSTIKGNCWDDDVSADDSTDSKLSMRNRLKALRSHMKKAQQAAFSKRRTRTRRRTRSRE